MEWSTSKFFLISDCYGGQGCPKQSRFQEFYQSKDFFNTSISFRQVYKDNLTKAQCFDRCKNDRYCASAFYVISKRRCYIDFRACRQNAPEFCRPKAEQISIDCRVRNCVNLWRICKCKRDKPLLLQYLDFVCLKHPMGFRDVC